MKPRKAIGFFDFQPEYMSTLTITSASVITAQPVRLDFDVWMTVRSGNIRIGTDVIATDIPCSSFSVFSSGKIIEIEQVSDDFEADLFLLSKKFQDDLSI